MEVPKRKIKEEKPKKRLGKKEVLIVPIIMGGATLVALLLTQIVPPPNPTEVCLKSHNVETFQLYPRVEVIVDGQHMMLPDTVGKQLKDGQDCLRPIHTDEVGTTVHIEYIRPIRFNMADFMNVYSNNTGMITVVNNSTGVNVEQVLNLDDYNVQYSYYSERNEFTPVASAAEVPPFRENMLIRTELTSK
ncbi:hypothetical protein [Nitrososphaera sp.]|uniref:hypothetical protein n=1 Tax=Nitrososphaera sp. TaxID=1971748 RepID=UPI002ED967E1